MNHWAVEKKAFRLITTHTRRRTDECDRIPKESFVYANDVLHLYSLYRIRLTPKPPPLDLTLDGKLKYDDPLRGVTSYLFNARLSDFRQYLQQVDVARLVARNIRYNVGGPIGGSIRKTYEKSPHDFWYFHNGITIVCDKMPEENGVATLINPSVINGAQTLYAISESSRRKSPALVAVRAIVRGHDSDMPIEDDVWLQKVIRGVNTQNRVIAWEFRSNEPEQFELQDRFHEMGIFYERKRGEWNEYRTEARFKGFDRVRLDKLGQILTITGDKSGDGVLLVKKGIDHVFTDKRYTKLFPSRSKVAKRFERIYLALRLWRFLDKCGYKDSDHYRREHHAFQNCLWLLHQGVTSVDHLHSKATVDSIRKALDHFESRTAKGRRAKRVLRQLTKAVWAAWKKARKVDPEHWTANNFFKSAFGNRVIRNKAYPTVLPSLKQLSRELYAE